MSDLLERVNRVESDLQSLREDQRIIKEETRGQTAILNRIDTTLRGDGDDKPGLRSEMNAVKNSIKSIQAERSEEKGDRTKLKWMIISAVVVSWGGAFKAWLTGGTGH